MKLSKVISFFLLIANSLGLSATNNNQEQQVENFFFQYLLGQTSTFNHTSRIKQSEVPAYRDKVWRMWQAANNRFSEEKLIPLSPLSEQSVGRWVLPATLEPHAVMPYYWGTKGNQPSSDGYPLFLYIHGSGHKEAEWATGLKICQHFDDAPSAYFIPQIPNEGSFYRWWQKAKQHAWEKLLRQALVSGQIDPNRLYVFGISEGGYGSQRLASFYADYWAGAGPMAGGEPLKNAPVENCSNIAFSLLTGDKDTGFYRNVLSSYVKNAFDSLQRLHPDYYRHRIELIPGKGHGIDYRPTTPWLKQYKRNPYPKFVSWENFEMDGLYRKGFYNLAIPAQASQTDHSRIHYEMQITGNTIALNVNHVSYQTTEKDPVWGIEMKFAKQYQPVQHGDLTIYLCEELINMHQKVTITVNGQKVFRGKVSPNLQSMVNSCATFFDPARVYPASVDIHW